MREQAITYSQCCAQFFICQLATQLSSFPDLYIYKPITTVHAKTVNSRSRCHKPVKVLVSKEPIILTMSIPAKTADSMVYHINFRKAICFLNEMPKSSIPRITAGKAMAETYP